MALDETTTPLDELEAQTAERAIAKVSETAEERRRNRRSLAKTLSNPRIHHALDVMAFRGVSIEEAAEHAGCKVESLRQALRLPATMEYLRQNEKAVRNGYRFQALKRTNDLAQTATSEHVRLGANKALLVNPELKAPTPTVNVNVGLAIGAGEIIRPGIVIDCSRPDPRRKLMEQQHAQEAHTRTFGATDVEDVEGPLGPQFGSRSRR